jgi:hypothetical protein
MAMGGPGDASCDAIELLDDSSGALSSPRSAG